MAQTGYNIYLMIQLAQSKGLLKTDVEYDLIWETGTAMYNEFVDGPFDVIHKSDYDCISDFLDDITRDDVVFLWDNSDVSDSVFAYFPNTKFDSRGNKTSYSHTGQHSSCSSEYAKGCKLATPNEYEAIKHELESIGYKYLNILPELSE